MPLLQPIIVHWDHPIKATTDKNRTLKFKEIALKKTKIIKFNKAYRSIIHETKIND